MCRHDQGYNMHEEPGYGGTYIVATCAACGAELNRTWIPD